MENTTAKVDLENVWVNLAVVLRGDLLTLKRFTGMLNEHSQKMGFKVIFVRASGDRLFITKEVPKDLEEQR